MKPTTALLAPLLARLAIASQWLLQDDHNTASSGSSTRQPISQPLFNELDNIARLVDISYCVGYSSIEEPFKCASWCKEFPDVELIKTFNTGPLLSDSSGYLAVSHSSKDSSHPSPIAKTIFLGFRGTYSLANTVADLSTIPQSYDPYVPEDGNTAECPNCTVHTGFLMSWHAARDAVLPDLTQALSDYPDYKLSIAGHSLGGAVALLAGLEMVERGAAAHVTTFGEPRVGNRQFVEHIDRVFAFREGSGSPPFDAGTPTARRVTHAGDPIPLLPLTEWGFLPHGHELHITRAAVPPSASDVVICHGRADGECSGGEDDTLAAALAEEAVQEKAKRALLEKEKEQVGAAHVVKRGWLGSDEMEAKIEDRVTSWGARIDALGLVPGRFKLWELFSAHRDYFWRLGLCVGKDGDGGWWGDADEQGNEELK